MTPDAVSPAADPPPPGCGAEHVADGAGEEVVDAALRVDVSDVLEAAADDLVRFIVSEEGQGLLLQVGKCYQEVQGMASFCRARSRAHGALKGLAGAVAVGASVTLGVSAVIVSGGTATPAVLAGAAAAMGGASVALAAGSGAQVATVLVSLGWNAADAKLAAAKLESLLAKMQQWDTRFKAILDLAAKEHKALSRNVANALTRACLNAKEGFSRAKTAGFYLLDVNFLTNAFSWMSGSGLGATVHGAGAQQAAAFVAARAGADAAQRSAETIFLAMSGMSIISGLMDVIGGLSTAVSGSSEAADMLDAQADAIAVLLHAMLRVARGTAAADDVLRDAPRLLMLEVHEVVLPAPSYRWGDLAQRFCLPFCFCHKEQEGYFAVTMGSRRTRITAPNSQLRPWRRSDVGRRLLLRALPGERAFSVQAFCRRALAHRLTCGNSSMGPAHEVEFEVPLEKFRASATVNASCCFPNCIASRQTYVTLSARLLEG